MKVVLAIIMDTSRRVLITRRASHLSHGGFWEFPGGKLEADEQPSAALIREIKEEVGLEVLDYHFLGEVNHTYGERAVSLLVYHVSHFDGDAQRCEGQMDLCWAAVESLHQFQFPAANHRIIELIHTLL